MLQNVRFTRCLVTRPSLFGKGVIMKTPGVCHSTGHSEFPDPRCPQLWEVAETKFLAGPSRITGPAELIEMVQYPYPCISVPMNEG